MLIKRLAATAALLFATAGLVVLAAGPASAHEERAVGPYSYVVGFGEEPAYAGFENSVALFLFDEGTGAPVTDLTNTLKVEVIYGDQTMPAMTLEPNFEVGEFGAPGDYRAFFFPTRPGDYSFHFTGSIHGTKIDEEFTSSETTFSSVEDPTKVEFPVKDPTTGQLSERLDREFPRIENALSTQESDLKDKVDSARLLAIIGLVVGGLGLVVGAAGLVRRRS